MNNRLLLPAALLVVTLSLAGRAQQPPARTATPLAVGSVAPAFKGRDAAGRPIELQQLLKKGPVVLYFYRGQWCPYCNKQLSQLQDSLQLLTAKGAQVVVVPPKPRRTSVKPWRRPKRPSPLCTTRTLPS